MCQSYLFNKVAGLVGLQLYEKEALTQVFSCEFCEIFKNTSRGFFDICALINFYLHISLAKLAKTS